MDCLNMRTRLAGMLALLAVVLLLVAPMALADEVQGEGDAAGGATPQTEVGSTGSDGIPANGADAGNVPDGESPVQGEPQGESGMDDEAIPDGEEASGEGASGDGAEPGQDAVIPEGGSGQVAAGDTPAVESGAAENADDAGFAADAGGQEGDSDANAAPEGGEAPDAAAPAQPADQEPATSAEPAASVEPEAQAAVGESTVGAETPAPAKPANAAGAAGGADAAKVVKSAAATSATGVRVAAPAAVQPAQKKAVVATTAGKAAGTAKAAVSAKKTVVQTQATKKVKTQATAKSVKQLLANGLYFIESMKNLRLMLDMNGESKANGGNAIAWTYTGGKNQKWRLAYDAESGCYYLANANSGKVLAVKGGKAKNGANVLQWAKKANAKSQLWRITYSKKGYTLASALDNGFVLGLQGGASKAGTNANLQAAAKSAAQRWWFVPLKPTLKAKRTLADGVYTIARSDAAKLLVDVSGVSQDDGANVDLWKKNGGQNQKWAFVRGKGNLYTIISVASGKALDIADASFMAGANVLQWTQNKGANQKWAVQKNADGSFSIVSALNGMALSIAGNSKKSGANVRTDVANGAASEKFTIKNTPIITSGVYSVGMRSSTTRVMDVPNNSTKKNTKLNTWSYNGGLNQKYQVTHVGKNVYTLRAGNSGKYVADKAGTVVQASGTGKAKAQRWKAEWRGTGIMLVNVSTGKALTVENGSKKAGTALLTAKAKGSSAQRFAFTERRVIDDGMYILQSLTGSRVLDIEGESTANGANADLWKATGNNNQKFEIVSVGKNYKIVNVKSGKVLDVADASKANGANVLQWSYNGGKNQLWKAELSPSGGVVFVNVNSGKALDVTGGANKNGTNVQVYTTNGEKAQAWMPVATEKNELEEFLERALAVANRKSSDTNYLVTVDLTKHRTIVFQRSGGSWTPIKNWSCTTGAPSSPTVLGDFTVAERGYSFGEGFTCYYWTQFYGDYLFHSVLYHEGTNSISDGRLGRSLSHGCVRLDIDNARWIYNNIPRGTRVSTFY